MLEVWKLFMEVIVGIENIKRPLKNPVLTIGNFDGVHRGHQALFGRVREWARELGGESVVMTFHPHPLQVLCDDNGPVFITLHERKLELIAQCGIDVTLVVPFSLEFAQISAHDFVKGILVDRIGVKAIVVGYDYKFGHGREGDIAFLKEMGERHDFSVDAVAGIEMDGTVVSSTLIRQFIHSGDLKEVGRLLGRPYAIAGKVIKGRERGGRLLGFPTANLSTSRQASPRQGVYAVEVEIDGKIHSGAANLGYNPTFGDTDLSLEVHIMDFCEDIYDKLITVHFIDRLRDEKRFSSIEDLAAQIRKDVQKARKILTERMGQGD